jgi:hypothetical protein
MAIVDIERVTSSGITATVNNAAAGGDQVRPGAILRVSNGSASPITLTLVTPQTVDGDLAVADRVVTIANAATKYVAATEIYRDKTDNLVHMTWSAVTTVTFEVVA